MKSFFRPKFIFFFLLAIVFGLFLFQNDRKEFFSVLQKTKWTPLIFASLLNVLLITCKAIQWKRLLNKKKSFLRFFSVFTLWLAGDHLFPFRLADGLKIKLLSSDGISKTRVIGALLPEAFFGTLTFLILVGISTLLIPFSSQLKPAFLGLIGLMGLLTLIIFLLRYQESKYFPQLRNFLREAKSTASPLQGKWHGLDILSLSFGFKITEGIILILVQKSVGLNLPFTETLFVLLSIGLAVTLPISAANLGTFELSAFSAYKVLGVPTSTAMASAILFHAVLVIPTVVAAMFILLLPKYRLGTFGSNKLPADTLTLS